MSVATTGRSGGGGGGSAAPPNAGGLRGVPPIIFDGTCSQANEFWDRFCWYKLVN